MDVIAQPAVGRRKAVLVADMDSTIITTESLDELARFAGVKKRVQAITARSMNGEIDFARALRERVALLAGVPASALEAIAGEVVLTPGAKTLVRTMRAAGAYTLLVSGGFTRITARVRALAGFDRDSANELEIRDGRLTGRVIEPILDREGKKAALED
ncbi:MAG: phosphoserine phosphatase SerB, partial [Alphaproteobacteria bacterium]